MKSPARYALFDWDNTLRADFTIIPWMEYLYRQSCVSKNSYLDMVHQFELHKIGKISYSQLSNNTTKIYAQSLNGLSVGLVASMAQDFCNQDRDVFPFVKGLFEALQEATIETIIISGAPEIVLLQYANLFGIDRVYGMAISDDLGTYAGNIKHDYGADKKSIVDALYIQKKERPIFALGDSAADEPLIKAAKYGCFINKDSDEVVMDGTKIGKTSEIIDIITRFGIL